MATGPTLAIMEFIQKLKTEIEKTEITVEEYEFLWQIIKTNYEALGSYREYNEIAFHTAIEVLLRNISIRYISELQLITKYKENSQNCEITYGFSDIFLPDNNLGQDCNTSLEEFDKILQQESEELLLERNYTYWCKGKVYNDGVGVADNRITGGTGRSHIRGYLIASLGTQRVISKSIITFSDYQYYIKN
ncbi:7572_t:CDS:2 [Funneliformis caledonium]|uniref:7572_t:CDS:1 n=1 Tax=Funneliformis caledonium TaxID=1117310 RepID=A0A9N8ZKG3_9GLOM|nr:7572_t:CDS:2 [Funneliformis caledonium]